MRSRISFFDKTVYRKDMTRYAPVWLLYLLCLLLGMVIMYTTGAAEEKNGHFWFPVRMGEGCLQLMAVVNMLYALLVAMLLFADLYNSRMCNALHALPLRRETWLMTHVAAGLSYSLIPTAVMAAAATPFLATTSVADAWLIGPLWFVIVNLQYLCFFGMAVLCAMCVGNLFALVGMYGVVNVFSLLVGYLVNQLYVPMLYGVIMPTRLIKLLCPAYQLAGGSYVEFEPYLKLLRQYNNRPEDVVGSFTLAGREGDWLTLALYALAGMVFLGLAVALYRRRRLETAGDMVAFEPLKPVLLTMAALAVGIVASFLADAIMLETWLKLLCLVLGLMIGWFGGRMLLERSFRVFQPKKWAGLAVLSGVLLLCYAGTYYDWLGIEERIPGNVVSVEVSGGMENRVFTDPEDIELVKSLHALALEDRLEEFGAYSQEYDMFCYDLKDVTSEEERPTLVPCRNRLYLWISYTLSGGGSLTRNYVVWADGPEREILVNLFSRWEDYYNQESWEGEALRSLDLTDIRGIYVTGVAEKDVPPEACTPEAVEELFGAIQADYAAGNGVRTQQLHDGHFTYNGPLEDGQTPAAAVDYTDSLSISIITGLKEPEEGWEYFSSYDSDRTQFSFEVFADMENTLQWLEKYDLLKYDVSQENVYYLW